MKSIKTSVSEISVQGEITTVRYFKGVHISLEIAKKEIEILKDQFPDNNRLLLVDIKGIKKVDKGARNYFASIEEAKKAALLIDNGVSKVIGNFFMGLNKPVYPTQLFTSEKEAIAWLKELK